MLKLRGRVLLWPLLYVALTFALCAPYSLRCATHLPDSGDALLGVWIVWSGATHLGAGYPGMLEANAYYPHPYGLAYTEPMLAQAAVAAALLKLLGNLVLVVNLVGLLSLALGAWGAHLLLRELTGDDRAAFLGAVTYAFCARSFYELARIQLLSLGWIPLSLFFLHRLVERPQVRHALGLAVTSLVNGLACFYFIVFQALCVAFVFPAYVASYRLWRERRTLALLAAAGIVLGLGLLFVAWPFLRLYSLYGFVGKVESIDVMEYLRPVPGSWLGLVLGVTDGRAASFLGPVASAASLVGLLTLMRLPRRPQVAGRAWAPRSVLLAYVVLGAGALVLSFGPDLIYDGVRLGPAPYTLVDKLPLLAMVRSAPRLFVLARLGMAVLVAVAAATLLPRLYPRPRLARATVALAAVLLVGEQWSPRLTQGELAPLGANLPEVYASIAATAPQAPLAELPVYPFHMARFNAAEAAFSTAHGRPILFAKASHAPPAMEYLRDRLERFPDASSITLLRALGVATVVVHPQRWRAIDPSTAVASRLAALDALVTARDSGLVLERTFGERTDDLALRFHIGGERVYRLKPLAAEGVPRPCSCREVERRALRAEVSGRVPPRNMFDRDRRTRWTTGRQQIEGDTIVLGFDRPRRVARLEIELGFPYNEFARHVVVEGRRDGQWVPLEVREDVWADVALIRRLVRDPSAARLRYDLAGEPVDRLALRITERDLAGSPWSISELHVFELKE